MSTPPRILILTAAFGEGHNSAARNLALALTAAGAVVQVCDPCSQATPRLTRTLERLYRFATDHLPMVWKWIYDSIEHADFSRDTLGTTARVQIHLAGVIDSFQPTAVVSTYPLYPYLLARIFAATGRRIPIFTAVTDSMEINAAWLCAPSDWWLVTDAATRETMHLAGIDPVGIADTGFPVHPVFAGLAPLSASAPCDPFRVLFFPTARRRALVPMASALLAASPAVCLTIVLGRNVRLLHREARSVAKAHPGRVRVRGWTRRVPALLASHHLIVGKAGGATVHEAIAATCPMLIHHLVPGQEEGNLRLLQRIGAGDLADAPAALTSRVAAMLAADAAGWRDMKHALSRHDRKAGALVGADLILALLRTPPIR